MTTETLDKLYLEISQFTGARTARDLEQEKVINRLRDEREQLAARVAKLESIAAKLRLMEEADLIRRVKAGVDAAMKQADDDIRERNGE